MNMSNLCIVALGCVNILMRLFISVFNFMTLIITDSQMSIINFNAENVAIYGDFSCENKQGVYNIATTYCRTLLEEKTMLYLNSVRV